MHEWALADAVIQTVIDVAQRKGLKKITLIKMSLGELQDVEQEFFNSALTELMKTHGTLFAETKMDIRVTEALFKCRACGHKWKLKDTSKTLDEEVKESIHFIPELAHSFIRCPVCKSPDFDIVEGRGVTIKSISGEK
ncbi:MAG TPA: hydrogenase nickel incorporation protein HypA [Thermoplasmata archaeon]|nr:hydrogenase nickel incorporation protein HypA [Thermoplasmata archaeon]